VQWNNVGGGLVVCNGNYKKKVKVDLKRRL
jgi:hypothetical protein